MNQPQKPRSEAPRRPILLAAIDVSPDWPFVVERAAEEAKALGAELHLIHAVAVPVAEASYPGMSGGGTATVSTLAPELLAIGKAHLASALRHAAEIGAAASGHVSMGDPPQEIVARATELGADRVVIGTHDRSAVARLLMGSVSEEVAKNAPCEVLIVRSKHEDPVPEILPPCPDCVIERSKTGNAGAWCARHSEHHAAAHTYSETGDSYGAGSQTFH